MRGGLFDQEPHVLVFFFRWDMCKIRSRKTAPSDMACDVRDCARRPLVDRPCFDILRDSFSHTRGLRLGHVFLFFSDIWHPGQLSMKRVVFACTWQPMRGHRP